MIKKKHLYKIKYCLYILLYYDLINNYFLFFFKNKFLNFLFNCLKFGYINFYYVGIYNIIIYFYSNISSSFSFTIISPIKLILLFEIIETILFLFLIPTIEEFCSSSKCF